MAVPPVAKITETRGLDIRASTSGTDGSVTTWTHPSGAPAATAASPMMRAASAQTAAANGCGEMTMALRVNSANMIFAKVVATGLVDGVSARITPAGRGNRTILACSSTCGLT